MAMTLQVAQTRISREIQEAETAISEALLRGAQLFTSLVAARQDLGMASALGHETLLRLTKTQQALLSAEGDMVRVHGGILDINRTITGNLTDDCPARAPTGFKESQAA